MFLRLCLFGVAMISSFVGNLGFKSSDPVVGIGAILIAILCFFFLAKGLWRFLGCLTTFIIVAVVVGGLVFFLSGSDALSTITSTFMGAKEKSTQVAQAQNPQGQQTAQSPQAQQVPALPPEQQMVQAPTLLEEDLMFGGAPQPQPVQPQPQPVQQQPQPQPQPVRSPMIVGNVESIIAGDVLRIAGRKVRLYGVATPLIDQICTDASGVSFQCGYTAARMVKDFISGDEVTCRVMNINAQKELLSACSIGGIDIGAAIVEAGWAIALPNVTAIYMPYQKKAEEARSGLWAGSFQMPWTWAAQKAEMRKSAQKVNVKDYMPKVKKKSIFNAL